MAAREQQAETPEQIVALAERWFQQPVSMLRASLGAAWPEHRGWLLDCLRQAVRQRLTARGWWPHGERGRTGPWGSGRREP